MNWHNILTVYAKELKHSLRDRRTLMSDDHHPDVCHPRPDLRGRHDRRPR